jgi:hypothetical protein
VSLFPSGGVTVVVVLASPDPLWPPCTVEPELELDLPGRASAATAAMRPVAAMAPAATHAVSRESRRRPCSRDRGLGALIISSLTGEPGSQLRIT